MKKIPGPLPVHIIGCIAFLSLPVLFSPDVSWSFHFLKVPGFQRDFFAYSLLLIFFYFNYFYLLPRFYFKQKLLLYAAVIALAYCIITFLPNIFLPIVHPAIFSPPGLIIPPETMRIPYGPPPVTFREFGQHLFQFLIILSLSIIFRTNLRLKQVEKDKAEAELSYLKAQINPHFLFNTLNSIYSSAITENADNTAGAIVKLSGMMRYVISEAHQHYVSLEREINYITDYIELQQIRLGNTIQLHYTNTGDPSGKKIAPLILISFIENAFKHGVNPEEASVIEINIEIDSSEIVMTVNNRIVHQSDNASNSRIGLGNTSNRLKLYYPSTHELSIREEVGIFMVRLKIKL